MKELRVVRLIDPQLCAECRFSRPAIVGTDQGTERMIHCTRLDCDNWDASQSLKAKSVRDVTDPLGSDG